MIAEGDFCYIDAKVVNHNTYEKHVYTALKGKCPCDDCLIQSDCKIECLAFRQYTEKGKWEDELVCDFRRSKGWAKNQAL